MIMDLKSQCFKVSVVPNMTCGIHVIAVIIPAKYFVDIDKLTLLFIEKTKNLG